MNTKWTVSTLHTRMTFWGSVNFSNNSDNSKTLSLYNALLAPLFSCTFSTVSFGKSKNNTIARKVILYVL